jgi:hypothetical protein
MTISSITAGSGSSFSSSSSTTNTDQVDFLKGFDFVPKETYVSSFDMLEKFSVTKLGTMDDATYDQFIEKMIKIAKEKNIIRPFLGVGIKIKPCTHYLSDTDHPIVIKEWDIFKSDSRFECVPSVYLVDGSKHVPPL